MSSPDFSKRPDRLNKYLKSEAKNYIFAPFSLSFLKRAGLEFLDGVELPMRPEDLLAVQGGGIDINSIADNTARILGIDTHFPHAESYTAFLRKTYTEKLCGVLCGKGRDELLKRERRKACIYFRAALMLFPEERDAMFGYASVCRDWYLSLEGDDGVDELVKILKSESVFYYERLAMDFPDFSPAFYYLGFAYLNMGLYSKARAAWRKYMESAPASAEDEKKEIEERLSELSEPVKIEAGINHILAGRYKKGLEILEPYTEGNYAGWWPLHAYLAAAYRELGFEDEAIEGYKRVLTLSPSNIEAAENLAELYFSRGDAEKGEKYAAKVEIFKKNREG